LAKDTPSISKPKKFWSQKSFGAKKVLEPKKFWSQKSLKFICKFTIHISTIALAFPEIPRQLQKFLCIPLIALRVEPPVMACVKLSPDIVGIKVRLG